MTREEIQKLADAAYKEAKEGNINFWTIPDEDPEVLYWKEIWIKGFTKYLSEVDNTIKTKLTEYTDFLLEHGYTDTDVYDEPPTAIDRFLNQK